jgi:hypothetical protein
MICIVAKHSTYEHPLAGQCSARARSAEARWEAIFSPRAISTEPFARWRLAADFGQLFATSPGFRSWWRKNRPLAGAGKLAQVPFPAAFCCGAEPKDRSQFFATRAKAVAKKYS